MRVSLKWLKEYVDIVLPPQELGQKLTMAGLEVSGIQTIGGGWQQVFVGKVLSVDPHPNADRLKLATVDLGSERLTVVCGAPNVAPAQKIAFARVGAELIDGHSGERVMLKPAKIRGVLSEGMVCSEKELGISESHEGVMVLPEDAPLGTPLADYLRDTLLTIEVTPNRPDCFSVVGIAREVAALTGQVVHLPPVSYPEPGAPVEQAVSVEILAPDLCPRYCASLVTGIKVASSPPWVQERLLAYGMRPINNVVDVTNYVMVEYGQPLHAFDYETLKGKKILVRRARQGEMMMSLDGVDRTLAPKMLVIADAERAVAIAGVMGGAETEVTSATTSVLLEAANFNQASLHHTSSELRLRSEAVMRFEKGLSSELPLPALRRATQLLLELGGGTAAKGIVDVYPGKAEKKPILLSAHHVKRLLGMEVTVETIDSVLSSLGFDCRPADSPFELLVSVPYWRSDIHQWADLVEEVGRILGYDQIPTTMLSGRLPQQESSLLVAFKERVDDILVGCGMQEVITYSLTSSAMLDRAATGITPLSLANPMTAEQQYLRTSLRPGILAILSANKKYLEEGVRLFELGKVYLPRGNDLPEERDMLVGVLCGSSLEPTWHEATKPLDFYHAKGIVQTLFQRLGVEVSFEPGDDAGFRPGRVADLKLEGSRVGVVGELHPALAEAFELPREVYLFEVDLPQVLSLLKAAKVYQALPKFPAVVRDIAVVIDREVPAQKVANLLKTNPLVRQVVLFDLYQGEQLPKDKKSLAFRITYQSPQHTLTNEEVDQAQQAILEWLHSELGAKLRT